MTRDNGAVMVRRTATEVSHRLQSARNAENQRLKTGTFQCQSDEDGVVLLVIYQKHWPSH